MKKLLTICFMIFAMAFAGFVAAAVDINSATQTELEAVKGIGQAKAKAIMAFREKNGPFKSVDDLRKVKGFGAKTLDKLRPELTAGEGAAAAPAVAPAPAPAAAPAPKPATPAPAPAPVPAPHKK